MTPNLLFSREEFAQRLAAVRKAMSERGIEVLLLDDPDALFYVTGFTISENRWRCCIVPIDAEPVMMLRWLDEPVMRERSWLSDIVTTIDWRDAVETLADLLRKRGWAGRRLGLDKMSPCMPAGRLDALSKALGGVSFIDYAGVVSQLRLIKSPAEIAYLRRAAGIADQAMHRAIAAVGPGKRERDAAAAAAEAFLSLGADTGHTGPITSGRGEGFLHGHLHDHGLSKGDIVHLELVPSVYGYSARVMRSAVIGGASAAQRATFAAIAEIQDAQLAAMKPGAIARDVDKLCRGPMVARGLVKRYDNITGYTLGYYSRLHPRTSDFTRIFHPEAEWRLEANMVFHMYTSAQGLALSETVLVTDKGAERLTNLDRVVFER